MLWLGACLVCGWGQFRAGMGSGLWQLWWSGNHGAEVVHWESREPTLTQAGQKRKKLEREGLVWSGIFHSPFPLSPQSGWKLMVEPIPACGKNALLGLYQPGCWQVMYLCVPSFLGVGRVQWADCEADFTKQSSIPFQKELPSAWLILFLYSSVPRDKTIASAVGYEIFLLSFPKKRGPTLPGANTPCFNSLPLPLSLSRLSITAQLHFYFTWMLILLTFANPCPPPSLGTSLKSIIPLKGDEKCSLIARLASPKHSRSLLGQGGGGKKLGNQASCFPRWMKHH